MNNSNLIRKLVVSGGVNQLAIAFVGLLRVPLVISTFGTEKFASYAAALGFWTLIAAIGESARQRIRILEFADSNRESSRMVLWQSVGLACATGILSAFVFLNLGGSSSPDLFTFAVAFSCGIIYVPFAMSMGRLEGQFKFSTANFYLAVGQVLGFLITLLGCFLGQIWLVGFSVLFPFFLPGVIGYLIRFKKPQSGFITKIEPNSSTQHNDRPLLLLVLFSETLVYAIDGALVLRFAGSEQAAIFAVVQRIVSVFAILPMVIAPLSSALNIKQGMAGLKSAVLKIQIYSGLALSTFVMLLGPILFNLLSHGQLQLNMWTLTVACMSGLILALTTTEIQSATSSKLVSLKATVVSIVAIFNISVTVALGPSLGATAAFISTATGQLLYFTSIRIYRRRQK